MKRRKPLSRSTTPIKARKADKSKRRFANLRSPEYQAWIRLQFCSVKGGCDGMTECAHVKSRGAGGADRGNCVPLCRRHHREQHTLGIQTFQYLYHIDLAAVAAALDVQYQESR